MIEKKYTEDQVEQIEVLNDLVHLCHETAKNKGFWQVEKNLAVKLALIHSEVSEALEALRQSDSLAFREELADICIRVFDLAGYCEYDLGLGVVEKMAKNKKRKPLHGKAF